MASIKGIQLKGFKKNSSIQGDIFLANIYLNNKKVGTMVSDEQLNISINKKNDKEALINIARKYYEEHPSFFATQETKQNILISELVYELIDLYEHEKEFKKNLKNGSPITILAKSHKREENPFNESNSSFSCLIGVDIWDEKTQDLVRKECPELPIITVFDSLNSFIIE